MTAIDNVAIASSLEFGFSLSVLCKLIETSSNCSFPPTELNKAFVNASAFSSISRPVRTRSMPFLYPPARLMHALWVGGGLLPLHPET